MVNAAPSHNKVNHCGNVDDPAEEHIARAVLPPRIVVTVDPFVLVCHRSALSLIGFNPAIARDVLIMPEESAARCGICHTRNEIFGTGKPPPAVNEPALGGQRLFAHHVFNHLGEARDIGNHQLAAASLDQPVPGKLIDLPGHGLAVGAEATGDFRMGGGG